MSIIPFIPKVVKSGIRGFPDYQIATTNNRMCRFCNGESHTQGLQSNPENHPLCDYLSHISSGDENKRTTRWGSHFLENQTTLQRVGNPDGSSQKIEYNQTQGPLENGLIENDVPINQRPSASVSDVFSELFKIKPNTKRRNNEMGKKSVITADDLMDMMGRRSLRRVFLRNIDNMVGLGMGIAADSFHEFAENNLYSTLRIYGHYDTFISKSSVKVLLKYLWPKYGKHILMDVDGNFSMCSISIDKIKKSVLGFPELVNKTIRPGIYWVKVSDVGRGTYMIVLKNKIYSEGDISENGIRSEAKNFRTLIVFIGERQIAWKRRVQKEIDTYCSGLVTTSSSSDKIRVQSMGGGDSAQNDIIIRPMNNLMFPQKEDLLKKIQSFMDSEKIYKDNGIPYRKGFLLTGPRGTGKTSFAFSLAEYFHMECVSVDLSYFDTNGGANAFNGHNTIYIIDEIDAQLPKSRVSETHEAVTVDQQKIIDRLHKLLKAMDDMTDGCLIIGTTNFPDRLDPAIVRSGRFDEQVEFGNLDRKFATLMCKNRGLDPTEILAGEDFPINPAYLEQKLIDALLEKNNIKQGDLKSAEEVISEEYGVDVSDDLDDDDDEDVPIPSGGKDDVDQNFEVVASEENDAHMAADEDDDSEDEDDEETDDNPDGSYPDLNPRD